MQVGDPARFWPIQRGKFEHTLLSLTPINSGNDVPPWSQQGDSYVDVFLSIFRHDHMDDIDMIRYDMISLNKSGQIALIYIYIHASIYIYTYMYLFIH